MSHYTIQLHVAIFLCQMLIIVYFCRLFYTCTWFASTFMYDFSNMDILFYFQTMYIYFFGNCGKNINIIVPISDLFPIWKVLPSDYWSRLASTCPFPFAFITVRVALCRMHRQDMSKKVRFEACNEFIVYHEDDVMRYAVTYHKYCIKFWDIRSDMIYTVWLI